MAESFSAWLVEGADVERELDDIGNIWIRGRVCKTKDGRLVDLEYLDGSTEQDVPVSDLRPLLPVFVPRPRVPEVPPAVPEPPHPPASEAEVAAPTSSVSLRQRIAELRESAGLLDQNVQHLRARQDVGLAALQSANQRVAEAQSEMTQRMQCANECLLEVLDLVNEAKVTLGDAACTAGFRDLAVLGRWSGGSGGPRGMAKLRAEGHEVIEAWVPQVSCPSTSPHPGCAIASTLRLTGYPWPSVAETAVNWVKHHSTLGFSPILLFLDEPDESKEECLASRLSEFSSVHLIKNLEMRAAWHQHGPLWEEFGGQTDAELSAKQILNCATARNYCQAQGVDWLLCNLDLDEALCFGSDGVEKHFSAVPGEVSQIVYINHEAIVADAENSESATWFEQIQHFKISPVLKLPFIGRRFPAHDEEPQILDHPEGIGDKTLGFWQAHNARLSTQYNFKKRSGGNTCSYFDGYMRGKVAVRVRALENAIPRVHRWHGELHTVVCHPGVVSLLHYINCGGLDWFSSKYQIRGSEEANRLWFHVLAQERAKVGREALKELYDDVLSIHPKDLQLQISEGFVAPLSHQGSNNLVSCHQGFWGWAVVGLGDQLYVHMPLAAQRDATQLTLGEPVVQQINPGETIGFQLDGSAVPVLLCDICGERGTLVLDVLPSCDFPICLAVSEDQQPNFQWVSELSSNGWRCRIRTHLWPQVSQRAAVWIVAQERLGQKSSNHTVEFEELPPSQCSQCGAQLSFEPEMAWLSPELHFSYAAFYAAYNSVDGRAIADEATRNAETLELTYAEIEFAPFYQLLAEVALPQPGGGEAV